tara:strand:+ start:255 stop:626 length:372 start_codon:yes stop_codon:yes gene_type:complete
MAARPNILLAENNAIRGSYFIPSLVCFLHADVSKRVHKSAMALSFFVFSHSLTLEVDLRLGCSPIAKKIHFTMLTLSIGVADRTRHFPSASEKGPALTFELGILKNKIEQIINGKSLIIFYLH